MAARAPHRPQCGDSSAQGATRSRASQTLFMLSCGDERPNRLDRPAGDPMPDPAIDTTQAAITNEITVRFEREVTDERVAFLVDSIAQALTAGVVVTRSTSYTDAL